MVLDEDEDDLTPELEFDKCEMLEQLQCKSMRYYCMENEEETSSSFNEAMCEEDCMEVMADQEFEHQLDDNEELKRRINVLKSQLESLLDQECSHEEAIRMIEETFFEDKVGSCEFLDKAVFDALFEDFLVKKGVKSYGELAAEEIQCLFVGLLFMVMIAHLIRLWSRECGSVKSFGELKELVVGHCGEERREWLERIEGLVCQKYAHVCYGLEVASSWNKFIEEYFF